MTRLGSVKPNVQTASNYMRAGLNVHHKTSNFFKQAGQLVAIATAEMNSLFALQI